MIEIKKWWNYKKFKNMQKLFENRNKEDRILETQQRNYFVLLKKLQRDIMEILVKVVVVNVVNLLLSEEVSGKGWINLPAWREKLW